METSHGQLSDNEDTLREHTQARRHDTGQYDLGILFVHGIGQQTRGDTLVRFGESLVDWVNKWTSGFHLREDARASPQATIEVTRACLNPVFEEPAAPPYCEIKVRLEEANQEQSWLMAEAWWADAFMMPSYSDLAHWGFGVLPWIIVSHLGTSVRRLWSWLSHGSGIVLFALVVPVLLVSAVMVISSALLSVFVLSVLLVLWVLTFVPIPQFRGVVMWIQHMLSAIVGDCYIFLQSPVQAAAIKTQIAKDLHWIATRCRSVAIVAHSQGGAVTYETLCQSVPSNLQLLFTLGSGLNKLAAVRVANPSKELRAGWFILSGTAFLLLSFLLLGYGPLPDFLTSRYWGSCFLVIGLFMFLSGGLYGILEGGAIERERYDPRKRFGQPLNDKFVWLDYYASADPVPNGPLYDESKTPEYLKANSVEVHNRSALLSDHTTYWDNPDGFVSALVVAVSRLSGLKMVKQSKDSILLEVARYRRKWRVRWLSTVRILAMASAVGLLGALYSQLEEIGRSAQSVLQTTFLLNQVSFVLQPKMLGVVTVVMLILMGYGILYLAWKRWEKEDIKTFFNHSDFSLNTQVRIFFFLAAVFIEILLIVFAIRVGWASMVWDFELFVSHIVIGIVVIALIIGGTSVLEWLREPPRRLKDNGAMTEKVPNSGRHCLESWQDKTQASVATSLLLAIPFFVYPWARNTESFVEGNLVGLLSLTIGNLILYFFLAPKLKLWLEDSGVVGDLQKAITKVLVRENSQRAAEALVRIARESQFMSVDIFREITMKDKERADSIRKKLDQESWQEGQVLFKVLP